ncbi:hypothetical protein D9615_007020 [Tricholomella constricta]|uniref:Uncharacterized protein n=1 Tax=Tricholomella constricta TaxID=117010 RepID=A0A8H5H7P9_9AGAR|nr:hypothetical protein D9615_007020 [Tricholomella constricta]
MADPPRRKNTVPEERRTGAHARASGQSSGVGLGTTGDVAHNVLITSMDLLEFVPVLGLASAARVLLDIWDALQLVDMSTRCMHASSPNLYLFILDARALPCYFFLPSSFSPAVYSGPHVPYEWAKRIPYPYGDEAARVPAPHGAVRRHSSLREEISEAGSTVAVELAAPIENLTESFAEVHRFLQKQLHWPFLKQYIKYDEILARIRAHPQADAHGRFATGRGHAADSGGDCEDVVLVVAPPPPMEMEKTVMAASPSRLRESQILPALKTLHESQNTVDAAKDSVDLRALMRTALQTSSDEEILEMLQIGREEMPEAIKMLQRVLERVAVGEVVAATTTMTEVKEKMKKQPQMRSGSTQTQGSSGSDGEVVEGWGTLTELGLAVQRPHFTL